MQQHVILEAIHRYADDLAQAEQDRSISAFIHTGLNGTPVHQLVGNLPAKFVLRIVQSRPGNPLGGASKVIDSYYKQLSRNQQNQCWSAQGFRSWASGINIPQTNTPILINCDVKDFKMKGDHDAIIHHALNHVDGDRNKVALRELLRTVRCLPLCSLHCAGRQHLSCLRAKSVMQSTMSLSMPRGQQQETIMQR